MVNINVKKYIYFDFIHSIYKVNCILDIHTCIMLDDINIVYFCDFI